MATIIVRQETVGFWAGYLVFVKWNKIQALFSLRYSKDKASGKSWALLEQKDKVPPPEVKESLPVCTCAGRLLGVRKGRGRPTHSKCGHALLGLQSGIQLSKKVAYISWGGPMDQSDVKKETR